MNEITPPCEPMRRRLGPVRLWNMNLGFLGIQFGWGLQMANVSAIFEELGASAHQIPLLWLAAPLMGLIIQPIVGYMSDRTWTPWGRRRPYLLVSAVLAAVALVQLPGSQNLWEAALWLCLLDGSANVGMVPFRALVGDLLPEEQRTQGFALQSVMVGLGAIAAASLPWFMSHGLGVDNFTSELQRIPATVAWSFYIGAAFYLGTMLWTVVTTTEPKPDSSPMQLPGATPSRSQLWPLPRVMRELAGVQLFTWFGIFCFLLYFPPAVARNVFGAMSQTSPLYSTGIEWAGLCFALANGVGVLVSLGLPRLVQRWGIKRVHGFALLCGGLSLLPMAQMHRVVWLVLPMLGFGLLRASTLALPYAMLEAELPDQQRGMYQGIFNGFIVLPEIAISLGFGWIMQHWMHDNRMSAIVTGGVCLLVAAVLMMFVQTDSAAVDTSITAKSETLEHT